MPAVFAPPPPQRPPLPPARERRGPQLRRPGPASLAPGPAPALRFRLPPPRPRPLIGHAQPMPPQKGAGAFRTLPAHSPTLKGIRQTEASALRSEHKFGIWEGLFCVLFFPLCLCSGLGKDWTGSPGFSSLQTAQRVTVNRACNTLRESRYFKARGGFGEDEEGGPQTSIPAATGVGSCGGFSCFVLFWSRESERQRIKIQVSVSHGHLDNPFVFLGCSKVA
uniref:uncharacterized protein LOC129509898 n=1 Tax=Nyctereutes procyonoides TaxID=34880 RepID=UPI0024445240|nr:uncharacterized protein LOC129509898 [Nyctereutes procyonoides]